MEERNIEFMSAVEEYFASQPTEKRSLLEPFMRSLDFVKESSDFSTADLQRYLGCGYGTVTRVLDALCLLCVVELVSGPPHPIYRAV